MTYKFRRIVSPPGCWLSVFQFDPCDGTEKPVLSLRAAIILCGKRYRSIGRRKTAPGTLSGEFEVDGLFKTRFKYNFARTIKRLDGLEGRCEDLSKKMRSNQTYLGALIDYRDDTKRYTFLCTSFSCYFAADEFAAYPEICPDILSSSIVCLKLKTGIIPNESTKFRTVQILNVKCFRMQTGIEFSPEPCVPFLNIEITPPNFGSVSSMENENKDTHDLSQSQDVGMQYQSHLSLKKVTQISQSTVGTTDSVYGTDRNTASALSSGSFYVSPKTDASDSSTSTCSKLGSFPSRESNCKSSQKLLQPLNLGPRSLGLQSLTSAFQSQSTIGTPTSASSTARGGASASSPGVSYSPPKIGVSDSSTRITTNRRSLTLDNQRNETFESKEPDSLSLEDLEKLQPSLPSLVKLYERFGVYEKPIVNVG